VTLFRSGVGRNPKAVTEAAISEQDVTIERARMALAVSVIDDTLAGDRLDAARLCNALLEVRYALVPGLVPRDLPVPS
jgi:hypothetical protein